MTKEEKLQRLLEMQEHPERYTEEEIRQLMADEEYRLLYQQMVKATDALYSEKSTMENAGTAIAPQRHWLRVAAALIGIMMLSGIAYAAYHIVVIRESEPTAQETVASPIAHHPSPTTQQPEQDSIPQTRLFEDVPLDEMVNELATYYNKVVDIQNTQAHEVRLYYKWERKEDLESVVNDLNHFEHVSLVIEDEKLIVKP